MKKNSTKSHLKILIVIHSLGIGGAETMVMNLAHTLAARGDGVSLLILTRKESDQSQLLANSNIEVLNLEKPVGLSFRALIQFIRIIRRIQPDVIHSHLPVTHYVALAKLFTLSKASWFHTFHNIAKKETASKGLRWLNKVFIHLRFLKPVAISSAVRATIAVEYQYSENRIDIVSNGIELEKYQSSPRDSFQSPISLIHIGRFEHAKNHFFLVELMHYLHHKSDAKFTLQLVGDGPLRSDIERAVKERNLGMDIEFLGLRTDTPKLLGQADILLLPSFYEGQPMVILEAFAAGTPILASDIEPLRDLISHRETGFLSDLEVYEFANTLLQMLEDTPLTQKVTRSAFQSRLNYSAAAMGTNYRNLFLNLPSVRKND